MKKHGQISHLARRCSLCRISFYRSQNVRNAFSPRTCNHSILVLLVPLFLLQIPRLCRLPSSCPNGRGIACYCRARHRGRDVMTQSRRQGFTVSKQSKELPTVLWKERKEKGRTES